MLFAKENPPIEWNIVLHNYMLSEGFTQSKSDPCIYVNLANQVYIGIYVDDILYIGNHKNVEEFRAKLRKQFNITQGGP